MRNPGWETSEITALLRQQIDECVQKSIKEKIPQIKFSGFLAFIEKGSRKESEEAYFDRRKQVAAFTLYLQYHQKSEMEYEYALNYFQELLWAIINEFTWCVMAHLPQDKSGFTKNPETQIDLFAAETAATLAEIVSIHENILHPFIKKQIRDQINNRIFEPFLKNNWWWETVKSNWSAVCCGSIGMAALLIEEGEKRKELLKKVDEGLQYYLKSFGSDGACEEGIGYWVYGFGYYIYYIAMRRELDSEFRLKKEELKKQMKIAEFPEHVQMSENSFVPFSDVSHKIQLPTGLLSYLQKEYKVKIPDCSHITSFDSDHCYRFAHISRNLWWTDQDIFHSKLGDEAVYLNNKQWLLQRWKNCFLAVKGGNNAEQHNHNDVGSFVFSVSGELFLTDLGAGIYTADYFGEKRYTYVQTRSRYHNLPLLNGQEQIVTFEDCKVEQINVQNDKVNISMELRGLYPLTELLSLKRTIISDMEKGHVILQDTIDASSDITFEEGFVSYLYPSFSKDGQIILHGKSGDLNLSYDVSLFHYTLEELSLENHSGEKFTAYRIGLRAKEKISRAEMKFLFTYKCCH